MEGRGCRQRRQAEVAVGSTVKVSATEAQDRARGPVPDPDLDDPAAESRRLLELVPIALEPFERVVAAFVEGGGNLDKRFEPGVDCVCKSRRSESFAVMPLPRRRVLSRSRSQSPELRNHIPSSPGQCEAVAHDADADHCKEAPARTQCRVQQELPDEHAQPEHRQRSLGDAGDAAEKVEPPDAEHLCDE